LQEVALSAVPVGTEGRVRRVTGEGSLRRRLLEMGLIPGSVIKVEGVAPLGDPMEVRVRGYLLTLRRNEAASVVVEVD
jgi:Fe2+ transport system protein FeoA